MSIIDKAYEYARRKHYGQLDDDNKEYFVHHLFQVVKILYQVTDDPVILAAGYLHDVIEDQGVTYEELVREFGTEISDLVMEVTHEGSKKRKGYYFPRLRTERGYILKFADRLSNISRMSVWAPGRKHSYLRKSRFWKSEENEKPQPEIVPIILLEDMEESK